MTNQDSHVRVALEPVTRSDAAKIEGGYYYDIVPDGPMELLKRANFFSVSKAKVLQVGY